MSYEHRTTNTELRTQNYEHRTTNTEYDSYRHSHRAAPPTAFSRGPCRRSKETPLVRDSPGRRADHRAVRRSPLPSPVTWVSRIPPAGAVLGREQGYGKALKPRQVYRCSRCRCSRRAFAIVLNVAPLGILSNWATIVFCRLKLPRVVQGRNCR